METSKPPSQMKEELKKEIIGEVLDILRDELEENFREDFIQRVEEAELRAKEGNISKYTPEEFKRVFS